MDNSSAWLAPAHSHQHCVEHELAGYCRSRRPPDDLSGEQIHDDGEAEPSFPGANVCNIGNPSLAHRSNIETIAVGFYKLAGLTDLPGTGLRTHRHSSTQVTPLDSPRPQKAGKSRVNVCWCKVFARSGTRGVLWRRWIG